MPTFLPLSIFTAIFSAIVGLFFWLLKASLSQNLETITMSIAKLAIDIDKKVSKENCVIVHRNIDMDFRKTAIAYENLDKSKVSKENFDLVKNNVEAELKKNSEQHEHLFSEQKILWQNKK